MTIFRINLSGDFEGRILADCNNVRVTLPDGKTVTVPVEMATEVSPLVPPEPPNGTVMSDGTSVVIRCDDADDPEGRWWGDGWTEFERWHAIGSNLATQGWQRYVPDPAATAPALPWRLGSCERNAWVYMPKPEGEIYLDIGAADYTPGEVEQIATALLTAARRCREEQIQIANEEVPEVSS